MNRNRAFKVAAKAIKAARWDKDYPDLSGGPDDYYDYVTQERLDVVRKVAKELPSNPSRNDASAMAQNVMTNLAGIAQYLDQSDDQFDELAKAYKDKYDSMLKLIAKGSPSLSNKQHEEIVGAILFAANDYKDLPHIGTVRDDKGVIPLINDLLKEVRDAQARARDVISKASY